MCHERHFHSNYFNLTAQVYTNYQLSIHNIQYIRKSNRKNTKNALNNLYFSLDLALH